VVDGGLTPPQLNATSPQRTPTPSVTSFASPIRIGEVSDGGLPSRTDVPSLFAARTVVPPRSKCEVNQTWKFSHWRKI